MAKSKKTTRKKSAPLFPQRVRPGGVSESHEVEAAQGHWTVEPGRNIYFDGRSFMIIERGGGAVPAEVDGAAHLIVEIFNRDQVTPKSIYKKHMGGRGHKQNAARWTVEPGRNIYFDGRSFMRLERGGGSVPAETDGAAHLIVEIFNQESITPESIYKKHMGHAPNRRGGVREAPHERKHSMTYGELPPFEQFEEDIRRPDPEHDGHPYWPEYTLYPMELVGAREIELAERYGLDEFEAERQRSGRNTSVRGFQGDERQIYGFLEYLVEQFNDGDDEAGDLASSIMYTLGYEWI